MNFFSRRRPHRTNASRRDGYTLIWNCLSEIGQLPLHAHLHVIPRFDDEPLAGQGGRSAIKVAKNRRPDPSRRGSGRARSFGGEV
jgi:diadenosine tetraphosphate (Ap4A) HIT family hydrolase